MKKIILFGPYNAQTSLWIYTRAICEQFQRTGKFEIIDKQRNLTGKSTFYAIVQWIFGIFKTIFPGKFSSEDIILIPHSAHLFPPILLNTKAKKVHIVHDFFYYDEEFFKSLWWFYRCILYPIWYLKIHKFLYKLAFKKADTIVAISEATKKEIIRKFWQEFENKITVIYNGMDLSLFQSEKIHPRNPNIPDKKYILYIGSELDRKNLKNIIAGFAIFAKKYPEYIFVKAPNEWDLYRKNTLEHIKQSGLTVGENFIFLDSYFSKEELIALYQHAELFMFPTLKEGFGFPIIEAQACGVPVITSNREPMSELVPYKHLLVNPENPQEIAETIEKILQNPEEKKQLILEWKEFIKQFSWENTAKHFLETFKKIKK